MHSGIVIHKGWSVPLVCCQLALAPWGAGSSAPKGPPSLGSAAARGAQAQTLSQTFPQCATEAAVSGLHRKKNGTHLPDKMENPSVELIQQTSIQAGPGAAPDTCPHTLI